MSNTIHCQAGGWGNSQNKYSMHHLDELASPRPAPWSSTSVSCTCIRDTCQSDHPAAGSLSRCDEHLLPVAHKSQEHLYACLQSYFDKGPARVFHLRPDSLGIMLSLANVAAGAQVRCSYLYCGPQLSCTIRLRFLEITPDQLGIAMCII